MRHARPDYARIQDPAGLIPADEPVFLLRAQDKLAAEAIRYYAHLLRSAGCDDKIIKATEDQSRAFDAWPVKKRPDMPAEAR